METLEIKDTKTIIAESLENSMDYDSYRKLMDELVEKEASTGPDQSESMINYTKLNARRYRRWEKTLKLDENSLDTLNGKNLPEMSWLVITESWCGDAAHVMPVMKLLVDQIDQTNLQVIERDANLDLMDRFLTDGARSIPKLIAIDNNTGEPLFTYGPRPSAATQMVNDFKSEHGKLTPEFK